MTKDSRIAGLAVGLAFGMAFSLPVGFVLAASLEVSPIACALILALWFIGVAIIPERLENMRVPPAADEADGPIGNQTAIGVASSFMGLIIGVLLVIPIMLSILLIHFAPPWISIPIIAFVAFGYERFLRPSRAVIEARKMYEPPRKKGKRKLVDLLREFANEQDPGKRFPRWSIYEWFRKNYGDQVARSSVDVEIDYVTVNSDTRKNASIARKYPKLLYRMERDMYRVWEESRHPRYQTIRSALPRKKELRAPTRADVSFKNEKALQMHLSANLEVLEPGLKLRPEGVEYYAGGRFIDILAEDAKGGLVVIETKFPRGHEQTIGQITRYIGWVQENIADGRPVRGFIVAESISDRPAPRRRAGALRQPLRVRPRPLQDPEGGLRGRISAPSAGAWPPCSRLPLLPECPRGADGRFRPGLACLPGVVATNWGLRATVEILDTIWDAIAHMKRRKFFRRTLLLGNGFSIRMWPDFRYPALVRRANIPPELPLLKDAMQEAKGDFEIAQRKLDERDNEEGKNAAAKLRDIFLSAVATVHPDASVHIPDFARANPLELLRNFFPREGTEDLFRVFTLNYYLLLHWLIFPASTTKSGYDFNLQGYKVSDQFGGPSQYCPGGRVIWREMEICNATFFYLHGALHLLEKGGQTQKLTWGRGESLANIIRRSFIVERNIPLFVSEGDAIAKKNRIRRSDYLSHCMQELATSASEKEGCFFVYGWSFGKQDDHIKKILAKGHFETLYVGLHPIDAEKVDERVNELKDWRRSCTGKDLEVIYFPALSLDKPPPSS